MFGQVVEISMYTKFINDKGGPFVRPSARGRSALSQMAIAAG
jgi:hypothetical protein